MSATLNKCPFTGGDLIPYWPETNFWLSVESGLLLRNPMPTAAELQAYYEQSWSSPMDNINATGATDRRLAALYVQHLQHSIARPLAGLSVLDYGAGRGDWFTALADAGVDTWAVEPYGHEQLNSAQAFPALDDLPDGKKFDGIVMQDVIEHVYDPFELVSTLRQYLVPGGWLFIATPNSRSLNARRNKGRWREALNQTHLVLFNPMGMTFLLKQTGFTNHQRLQWHIPYSDSSLKNLIHWALLKTSLDGELRFLAYNS